jgi:hypothetical protein
MFIGTENSSSNHPRIQSLLDQTAQWLAFDDLPRNQRAIRLTSLLSLALLFLPGILFLAALMWAKDVNIHFAWFNDPVQYPWQFWGIAFCGTIATIGGAGDWWFHKIYVTVSPKEHHSHILALGAGGIVFLLMAAASWEDEPAALLIPVIVMLITTVVLISYDEFAFHIRRCKPFETLLHRMLVLGNGIVFLCWMHWLFASGLHHV